MTVVDVAKLARVSVATVSRVMNNSPRVKPETTEQVKKAIAQITETQPARVRRGPRQGKRNTPNLQHVAVITVGQRHGPWFQMPVMAAVISGIMKEARKNEVAVQIEDVMTTEKVDASLGRRIDGALLFVPSEMHDLSSQIFDRPIPIVRVMGESLQPSTFDHVGPDNVAIGQLAYEYLKNRGCASFNFMTLVPAWDLMRMRAHGFQAAACAQSATPPTMFLATSDAHRCEYYGMRVHGHDDLEQLLDQFLAAASRPAGLFVPRDADTMIIQRMLASRGLKINDEIMLISCDNEEIRLSALDPRPASIELGAEEIGTRALRQLLWRIARPTEPPLRMAVTPRVAEATA